MQEPAEFVTSLYRRGVTLWAENGEIHFRAPKGALSAVDLESLRAQKNAVVAVLEEAELDAPLQHRQAATGPLGLTGLQMSKWQYAHEFKNGTSNRTCLISQRVLGTLDEDALRRSFAAVVERHEALRIRLIVVDGAPRQQVDSDLKHELQLIDLQNTPTSEEDVIRRCQQLVYDQVDLQAGPLLAAKLFRLAPNKHVFAVATDHIICDGVSCDVLAEEIWALYRSATSGQPAELTDSPLQFLDYVAWQHRTQRAWLAKHGSYWQQHLRDLTRSDLSVRENVAPPVSPVQFLTFDKSLTAGLLGVARLERSLPAIVVLTICIAAIARWLTRTDLLLAFVSSYRDKLELQRVVGFLADYVHLRVRVDPQETFAGLLRRVTLEFRAAHEHQDYGRVPEMIPQCRPDIAFNWMANTGARRSTRLVVQDGDVLEIESFRVPLFLPMPTPFKVTPAFEEGATQIAGGLIYRPDVFPAQAMQELAQSLLSFAEAVVRGPHDRLVSLPMSARAPSLGSGAAKDRPSTDVPRG